MREWEEKECPECKDGLMGRSRGCGVYVCYDCGHHEGLSRCYCGWALDGGNGYQQLVELGEQVEEEDYWQGRVFEDY